MNAIEAAEHIVLRSHRPLFTNPDRQIERVVVRKRRGRWEASIKIVRLGVWRAFGDTPIQAALSLAANVDDDLEADEAVIDAREMRRRMN